VRDGVLALARFELREQVTAESSRRGKKTSCTISSATAWWFRLARPAG
jgi:hypothetical protein